MGIQILTLQWKQVPDLNVFDEWGGIGTDAPQDRHDL